MDLRINISSTMHAHTNKYIRKKKVSKCMVIEKSLRRQSAQISKRSSVKLHRLQTLRSIMSICDSPPRSYSYPISSTHAYTPTRTQTHTILDNNDTVRVETPRYYPLSLADTHTYIYTHIHVHVKIHAHEITCAHTHTRKRIRTRTTTRTMQMKVEICNVV